MSIPLVAEDAVVADVETGLEGQGRSVERSALAAVGDATSIVADRADGELLSIAHRELEGPWIAIEGGGLGGWAIEGVAATLAVLDAGGPCFRCLHRRVRSTDPDLERASETPSPAALRFAGATAAWWLERWGDLAEHVGTVLELDGPRREVHVVPGCECVGAFRAESADGGEPTDLEGALARAERALDARLGPITDVGEQSSYPTPYYLARLAATDGFSDATAARYAAGVDEDWDGAFMRALGESLERYCAGVYRLEGLASDPPSTPIALDRFPTARDDATPLGRWWPGRDLATEAPVSLPAEVVAFPPPQGADVDAITTGLGLGSTPTAATLGGLLEVIERDACMLAWYSTYEPVALAVDSEPYAALRRRIAGEGLGATAILVTQDIDVPVVTAVVHRRDADGGAMVRVPDGDPTAWPAFAVGSAARFDATEAAERALAEAIQNWVELDGMGPERAAEEGAIGRYADFPRAVRSLVDVEHRVPADSVGPAQLPTGPEALEHASEAVGRAGLDAYVAPTTTVDVARLGFAGVRVLVPDAQPLVRGETGFTARLRSVPRELGFRPRLDRGDHPYP